MKSWLAKALVEEIKWPAQSFDMNHIGHLFLNDMECQLHARLPQVTLVPDLINALNKWPNLNSHLPKNSGKHSQKIGCGYEIS